MPSDIIGTDVIEEDPQTGRRRLEFIQGPLFTHFLLADEINRAPPKTQSALLQAMQEQEVSVGRRSYRLEPPFFVIATQNPIEQEGTYPLPEAQLDRFMFNIPVDYPSPDEEVAIVKSTTANLEPEVAAGARRGRGGAAAAGRARRAGRRRRGALCGRSGDRHPAGRGPRAEPRIHKFLTYGASPRASQYLILGAKAMAVLSRPVPRRFRRRSRRRPARLAPSPGAQFPRPGRGNRCRRS